MRRAALVLAALAGWHGAQAAPADPRPGQALPLPEGWALPKATGQTDSYVFARITGTMKHTIDRPTVEAVCDTMRGIKPDTPKPLFEAGWDRPNTSETMAFTHAAGRVSFTTARVYVCSNQASLAPGQMPCGCHYRFEDARTTVLRRTSSPGQVETATIDHVRRTVRRNVVPVGQAEMADSGVGAALAAQWAPEVVGEDTAIGLPCTVRRKTMGGAGYMEWCVTPDDAAQVKDARLRGRALRHRKVAAGDVEIGTERTLQLVPDVLLDRAALAIPEGYSAQGGRPLLEVGKR